jgi:hypothetical protein
MRVLYINDHAAQGRWKVQKSVSSAAQPQAREYLFALRQRTRGHLPNMETL